MPVAERVSFDELETAPAAQAPNSIDNIIRLALSNVTEARPSSSQPKRTEPDFGLAVGLLDRATATMTALTAQRDALEQTVARLQDTLARQEALFADKLHQIQAETAEWERRAKIMKAQLQDSESRLSEQQIRAETLVYRAENAEAQVQVLVEQLDLAREQAQQYHDRIISTFSNLA